VAVLSNNDGCVIARSEAVKRMGVPMGAPYFKWKKRLEAAGVKIFSSNYELYADMSWRVMSLLEQEAVEAAVYSIDEAFLRLPDLPPHELAGLGRRIRGMIRRATGIPVRFGIGPTKTLAKLCNHLAKAEPDGVVAFPGGREGEEMLASVPVGEVWGIGRQYEKILREYGVTTARSFKNLPSRWVKARMTVTGLRTALELGGTPCLPLDEGPAARKTLVRSRSFSKRLEKKGPLREAVVGHVSRAAEKLRGEGLVARGLQVFIRADRFGRGPYYSNGASATLPRPTHYTPELAHAARALLERIYRPGYGYKKAGVMLFDLTAERPEQGHLFIEAVPRERALMTAMDRVNEAYGKRSVQLAGAGLKRGWTMKRQMKSPAYTTRWSDVPVVRA
jgi:DNA polymerase V